MIRLARLLKTSVQWFHALVTEQTKIEVYGKHADDAQANSLLVENDSTDMGLLVFAITTGSRYSIEILKIAIDYSMPLQLMDPGKMGFFQAEGTSDDSFPFRLFSDQRFELRSMLMHAFALIVQFPPGVCEVPVRVVVHARTLRLSVGGLESVGRTQVSSKLYRVVLSDKRLLGIEIPPKHSLTTIQPFLIRSGLTASGYGVRSSVSIREQSNDDVALSTIVEVSGTTREHQG